MPTPSLRQVRKALSDKGYRKAENDHEYYWFYDGERQTGIFTKVSHRPDGSDLYQNEVSGMKRQMCMSSQKQFLEYISCTMSLAQYRAHLVQVGQLIVNDGGDNDG
jgi:hypothetical protein